MKIWLINHYAVPPQYYPLARTTNFAKHLTKLGHEVKIIAASTVHNSDMNLIEDNSPYRTLSVEGIDYFLIKCHPYKGNGLDRIVNMWEFALKLPIYCNQLSKPDVIVSTSLTPMACAIGIKLAQKYGCKCIAEIADLWPETLIAYGVAGKNNPIVICLRMLEKWIYKCADEIVFTMEDAYKYIVEQNWQNAIPQSKVHYINNGVDLEQFLYNKSQYKVYDLDLSDSTIFKVVYTGSIRKVNNLGLLLDVAKEIKDPNIKILVWGDGDELALLTQRVVNENINNIVFKGKVDKRYVPFIVSHSDLNIAHNTSSYLFKYGISFNKLFDYLAAGRPVLCDFQCSKNPVVIYGAGFEISDPTPKKVAEMIEYIKSIYNTEQYDHFCRQAINAAEYYSFENLTEKLLNLMS